jgi:ribonuclease P protein component
MGKRFASANFAYTLAPSGYAVVVSKKVARLSVTRHKIKRRVLAALRTFPLPSGLIVFPRASAAALTYQETLAEIKEALSRLSR